MKKAPESLLNPLLQFVPQASLPEGKVLVIEDSVDQWLIIQKALEQIAPSLQPVLAMNAHVVDNLLQEWTVTQAGLPQLILLDLYLPSRHDGWKVLEVLQSGPYGSKLIPVVVMSNSRDLEDIIDAYQHSVQSYIVKPTEFSDWLNCCRTLLQYLSN